MTSLNMIVLAVLTVAVSFSTEARADSGAETFKEKCTMCHGADGKGETAMGKTFKVRDLGSAEVQARSDADLANTISNGKGHMPKFDGRLTKDQIGDVVKYIRTLKP